MNKFNYEPISNFNMTDTEADLATLSEISQDIRGWAGVLDILSSIQERGDGGEV